MEIKIPLKTLTLLFAKSAADETLPEGIRVFAAQLTVLTAHVQRVDEKIDAAFTTEVNARLGLEKEMNANIAELATHLITAATASTLATTAPGATPAATPDQPPSVPTEGPMDEEEEAEAMAARVIAETELEAASGGGLPAPEEVAAVTPILKGKAANGKKAPQRAGDAS